MRFMFLFYLLFLSVPARAQLVGNDTLPDDSCTAKGAVRMTANATGPGAYILTCDGDSGKWVATINAALPTANAQVANKEYVDMVLAAASIPVCTDNYTSLCALETNRAGNDPQFAPENIVDGINILGVTGNYTGESSGPTGPAGCAGIGDLCANGTVFAGWHPVTHENLFIPPADANASAMMEWKTTAGIDDIATDSIYDGQVNTDQVPNSTDFPAFKACKDLTLAGKNWYLPSQVELYYLWSVHERIEAKGNVTAFWDAFYWSSTEYNNTNVWIQVFTNGYQDEYNKAGAYRVRCMAR